MLQSVDNFVLTDVVILGIDGECNDLELIRQHELVVDLVDVFEHLEVVLIDVLVTRVQVGHPLGELFNEPVRLVAVDLVQGYDLHAVRDAREVTECSLTRLSRLQFVPIQPNRTVPN